MGSVLGLELEVPRSISSLNETLSFTTIPSDSHCGAKYSRPSPSTRTQVHASPPMIQMAMATKKY